MNEENAASQPSEIRTENFFVSDKFIMVCVYAAALTVHILMTLCTTIFNLTPDEYSVTAVSAYLNGMDWSPTVSTAGYYGYFQSLFYAPVFLITDDPYLRYRLMLAVNGVIISFAPVIIYYLGRRWFKIKKGGALLFAGICGFYPCYMLLTKYTWNETMCGVLPWIFALLMYRAVKARENGAPEFINQLWAVLGGLTLAAAYATHGRMLSLLAAGAVLEILVFLLMKKRIFSLAGFYVSMAAGFIADKFLKDFFQNALWLMEDGDKAPMNTIERMFSRVAGIDAETVSNLWDTLVGHFFYFISATWGFGAICIAVIISCIVMYFVKRNSEPEYDEDGSLIKGTGAYIDDDHAVFAIYAFLAMGAIFVVSAAFKGTSTLIDVRMDTVIYGRYTEVIYPVAIFATLAIIYKRGISVTQTFAGLFTASVINVLTTIFAEPRVINGERFVSAMIMGIAPMRFGEAMKDLPTSDTFIKLIITSTGILFSYVFILLLRRSDPKIYRFFAFPLAGLLLYTNVYCYASYTIPQSRNSQNGATYVSEALDMIKESGFKTVYCFSMARERYVKAQFLYPEFKVIPVNGFNKFDEITETPDFILGDREDNLNIWLDGVYLVGDINHNTHLYACSEAAVEWCEENGLELSQNGTMEYNGLNVLATTSVTRENGKAIIPGGAAIYTNYMMLYRTGTYYFTVYGENAENGLVTVKSNKGENILDYEIIEQGEGMIKISINVNEQTENVRFKLSNSGGDSLPITAERITVERADKTPMAQLPVGVRIVPLSTPEG